MMGVARWRAPAKRIEISAEDRAALERIVRSSKSERRMVERARIVLGGERGALGSPDRRRARLRALDGKEVAGRL